MIFEGTLDRFWLLILRRLVRCRLPRWVRRWAIAGARLPKPRSLTVPVGRARIAAHRPVRPRSIGPRTIRPPLRSALAGHISRHAARFAKLAHQLAGIEAQPGAQIVALQLSLHFGSLQIEQVLTTIVVQLVAGKKAFELFRVELRADRVTNPDAELRFTKIAAPSLEALPMGSRLRAQLGNELICGRFEFIVFDDFRPKDHERMR